MRPPWHISNNWKDQWLANKWSLAEPAWSCVKNMSVSRWVKDNSKYMICTTLWSYFEVQDAPSLLCQSTVQHYETGCATMSVCISITPTLGSAQGILTLSLFLKTLTHSFTGWLLSDWKHSESKHCMEKSWKCLFFFFKVDIYSPGILSVK